jgi:tRNA threonylcarbamoyladenosine biosynthesis protein TsaE
MDAVELCLSSLEETAQFGHAIGQAACAGDFIYLDGELGAGKTTLTKSIAAAIGVSETSVTSPTFSLIHEYHQGRIPLYHFDLYRLSSSSDLINLGFDDYVAAEDGLIVIEWSNKALDRLPMDALTIKITDLEGAEFRRIVRLVPLGERGHGFLARLKGTLQC